MEQIQASNFRDPSFPRIIFGVILDLFELTTRCV